MFSVSKSPLSLASFLSVATSPVAAPRQGAERYKIAPTRNKMAKKKRMMALGADEELETTQ